MIQAEVLVVGGGPAGSACAWKLKQQGIHSVVLDQAQFPRFKPCAGWITPEVLRDLQLSTDDYPHGLTTFTRFDISVYGIPFKLKTQQYSIRRYEFDRWLLQRSQAEIHHHRVKDVQQEGDGYTIDGEYTARYLVGAGGTHCPVYRTLFQPHQVQPRKALIVAQEEEFLYANADDRCRLWFFEDKLPGYAWYVPKQDGYVNVGVGGSAAGLKANGNTLKHHWNLLAARLDKEGLIRGHEYKPSGHSYYLREKAAEIRRGNAFLVGDALGLATVDMGEGIGPAIQSGLRAAEAIMRGKSYSIDTISRYSFPSLLGIRR
jgi:menaquinone-9 beta-reductase